MGWKIFFCKQQQQQQLWSEHTDFNYFAWSNRFSGHLIGWDNFDICGGVYEEFGDLQQAPRIPPPSFNMKSCN